MSDANSEEGRRGEGLVLVARKGRFGLPTACPNCLPVYIYLRFANASFELEFDVANPDSDHVPYVEYGDCVTFNNENGGVIESLKRENIVNLDAELPGGCFPDWLAAKALVGSWLEVAAEYELWVASKGSEAYTIYFSDLPWPVGKALHWRQTRAVKQRLGITYLNATEKEEEIYRKAALAYEALSQKLGEQTFFFDHGPTSLDAIFLGHSLFVLHALPDTSILRSNLLQHDNLIRYSENLKAEHLGSSSSPSSSSIPRSPLGQTSSSTPRRKPSYWSSKAQPKPKREKTEEEKTFRRRAKYFLATQLVAVVVFLSLFGGVETVEDDDEEGADYDD